MTFLVVAIISVILSLLFADDAKLLSIIIDIIEDISLKDIGIYIVDSIVPERRAKRRAKKAQEEAERKKKREDWEKKQKELYGVCHHYKSFEEQMEEYKNEGLIDEDAIAQYHYNIANLSSNINNAYYYERENSMANFRKQTVENEIGMRREDNMELFNFVYYQLFGSNYEDDLKPY